ncbi:hypothetical protein AALB81_13615 [Lachnospiraceae bacterium 48-33]
MEGIFYIASGEKYYSEAMQAIRRTKKVMPNLPIALCTDWNLETNNKEIDYMMKLNEPSYNFNDKVKNYINSPFDRTIFLDTDTYLVDSVEPIFKILDRFDIVSSHAPIEEDEIIDLPDAFAEMNSGVIAYKKNNKVNRMFEKYMENYLECFRYYTQKYNDVPPDQPSFRYAIYNSDVQFCFLPHEYNCMLDFPCFLSGRVHILHGHYSNKIMEEKAKVINAYSGLRLYSPESGIIY